jgi:hypothetical protein
MKTPGSFVTVHRHRVHSGGTTVRRWIRVLTVGVLAGAATGAQAQDARSIGAAQPEQMRARFQIAAMEGVLERAVQLGARRLSQQVQSVSPDMLFIAGAARARGFWLDDYGVFFDVDVPALRRSVAWSFRVLGQGNRAAELAMQKMRTHVAAVQDVAVRRQIEEELRQLERTVLIPVSSGGNTGATGTPTAEAAVDASTQAIVDDPGLAYTNEVKAALMDAMLEYGAPIPIGESQWLTIAARDDHDSRIGGGDPYDVATIVLRIRGADLDSYRSGGLTRDEALTKVEVREY